MSRRFFLDKDDILKINSISPYGIRQKLTVIPKTLISKILEANHSSPLGAGHFGIQKTTAKIKSKYTWPGMTTDIENYIKNCTSCQLRKKLKRPLGMLQPIKVIDGNPMSHIEIDYIGPLPKSKNKEYILTAICKSSKFAVAKAYTQANSKNTIDFIHDFISQYSCPQKISCDNGTHFKNKDFSKFCKNYGIKLQYSSSYCPQTQGAVEKMNSVVCDTLSHYVNTSKNNWSDYLKYAIFSYNITPVAYLNGLSPFYLFFGKTPNLPIDNEIQIQENEEDRCEELDKLNEIRTSIPKIMEEIQKKYKIYYDKKHMKEEFKKDDYVLIQKPFHHIKKLHNNYFGPFKIIKKLTPLNYIIDKNGNSEIIHIRRLKRFNTPPKY